jgi:hypothetical protein
MNATPNCTVAVYRATGAGDYADLLDDNTTAVVSGVPAFTSEQTRRVWDQATATPRTVRYCYARVPAGTDIRAADRLTNEQTGTTYYVDAVSPQPDTSHAIDLKLDLRRTD